MSFLYQESCYRETSVHPVCYFFSLAIGVLVGPYLEILVNQLSSFIKEERVNVTCPSNLEKTKRILAFAYIVS